MRLNVRLIGILAGIVVVGEAGLVIIRLAGEANDSGAIPFAIWGAIVAGVGYVGVFFGRMIKAAVSRQREFLADSSSVQFTRNPDGLVSALEKIRKEGAVLASPFAGEMSHMYFGQAIKPKVFSDLFATHPSIDERIASIQGRKLAPAAGGEPVGLAQGLVNSLIALVGNATPDHVDHATNFLASLPESLRKSLDTPEGARRAVYGYLFGGDETVRKVQVQALAAAGDGSMAAGIDDLVATLRGLGPAARLPVLTLALPALRQMDATARGAFLRAVDALVDADHEVTLDEFVVRTILRIQLSPKSQRAERAKYKDIAAVRADMVLLLSTLARAGSSDTDAQKAAFAKGGTRLGFKDELPPGGKLAADSVSEALGRLRLVTPLVKPQVIAACVDTALADEQVTVPEMELLRAIGMAIDCPLPPTLEAKAPTSPVRP
jgi:hypothetical protein